MDGQEKSRVKKRAIDTNKQEDNAHFIQGRCTHLLGSLPRHIKVEVELAEA